MPKIYLLFVLFCWALSACSSPRVQNKQSDGAVVTQDLPGFGMHIPFTEPTPTPTATENEKPQGIEGCWEEVLEPNHNSGPPDQHQIRIRSGVFKRYHGYGGEIESYPIAQITEAIIRFSDQTPYPDNQLSYALKGGQLEILAATYLRIPEAQCKV